MREGEVIVRPFIDKRQSGYPYRRMFIEFVLIWKFEVRKGSLSRK